MENIWQKLDTVLERYFDRAWQQEGDLNLFRDLFGKLPAEEQFKRASHVAWDHFEDIMAPLPKREEKIMASEPVDKSMMVMDRADIHMRYVPGRDAQYILSIVKRSGSGVTLGDTRVQVALHGAELMRLVDMLDPRMLEQESTINGCNKRLREAVVAKEKAESALLDEKSRPKRAKRRLIVKIPGELGELTITDVSTVRFDETTVTLVVYDEGGAALGEFRNFDYWMWLDPDEGKSKNGEW